MKPTLQELLASLPEPVVHHIQHLERIRQDFVANVSHELRTPLTVIHGYLEALLIQGQTETQQWHKIFTQMHQQTLRMQNLIEDLLLLSRLECQEEELLETKLVDVPVLLQTISHEALEFSADSHHRIQLETNNDIFIQGNEEELRSLFSNIIFNAVKYTPPNGQIFIRWYAKGHYIYFSVRDKGIGIDSKHIPRLTERFYRIDPGRSRTSGGTGLGLAIVKHVLIRHHAKLEIKSKPGLGSTFTCVFPRTRISKQIMV